MKYIVYLILLVSWIAGIVIAKGFWSTFFSIVFTPWAYYLVVEHILKLMNWI